MDKIFFSPSVINLLSDKNTIKEFFHIKLVTQNEKVIKFIIHDCKYNVRKLYNQNFY